MSPGSSPSPATPRYGRSLPIHLPQPTPVPALFAFGVVLFAWGLISAPLLVLVGGVVVVVTLLEWIGEIWHDAK